LKVLTLTTVALALCASEARAEIVVLKNGRTMSVKSCRIDSDIATMVLREGGEVTFPASIVARVDPDEVPYPEAAVEAEAVAAPQARVAGFVSAMLSDDALAARPFATLISTVAAANDLDARLVHAVIEQESNYEPRARSKKGAKGLMQLMPDTARQYGVLNSYDPKANLEAGVRHLKDLMSRLDLPTALAAYNAGEGAIKRYGGLPPFPETQTYVRNILRRVTAN
ncbi:MAG: lytic transglycosylase domain-containing protein, partial [Acidobacteriota bacterium]